MKWYRFDIILSLFVASLFFGIFICYHNGNFYFLLVLCGLCFISSFTGICVLYFLKHLRVGHYIRYLFFYTLLISLGVGIGVIRFHIDTRTHVSQLYADIGKTKTISGYVISEPEVKQYSTRFIINTGNESVLVVVKDKTLPVYSSYVSFSGSLEKPKSFITDTDRVFAYDRYLAKDYISVIAYTNTIVVQHDVSPCCVVSQKLLAMKNNFVSHIEHHLPSPHSGLLAGILLGEKNDLDTTLKKSFVTTGTIHIVALSGYNVTIVANAVIRLLGSLFSRGIAFLFGGFGIVLFVIMTGMQTTAIRAGAMACVLLLTKNQGTSYNAFRALMYVSVGMVFIHPRILLWDISFQLSFLATLSIILYLPFWNRILSWIKVVLIRDTLASTLAAQMLVTPWIAYSIGTLSFISPIANLIILPVIPVLMFLGASMVFISLLHIPLVKIISYPTYVLLEWVVTSARFLSHVPFASITIQQFSLAILVGVYVCLFSIIYFETTRISS